MEQIYDGTCRLYCLQEGTEEFDIVVSSAVAPNGSVVLAGKSSGLWKGNGFGATDATAVKIDSNGREVWRWQV